MLSQEEPVPVILRRLSARSTKSPAILTYNEGFEQDIQIPSTITMGKDDDSDDDDDASDVTISNDQEGADNRPVRNWGTNDSRVSCHCVYLPKDATVMVRFYISINNRVDATHDVRLDDARILFNKFQFMFDSRRPLYRGQDDLTEAVLKSGCFVPEFAIAHVFAEVQQELGFAISCIRQQIRWNELQARTQNPQYNVGLHDGNVVWYAQQMAELSAGKLLMLTESAYRLIAKSKYGYASASRKFDRVEAHVRAYPTVDYEPYGFSSQLGRGFVDDKGMDRPATMPEMLEVLQFVQNAMLPTAINEVHQLRTMFSQFREGVLLVRNAEERLSENSVPPRESEFMRNWIMGMVENSWNQASFWGIPKTVFSLYDAASVLMMLAHNTNMRDTCLRIVKSQEPIGHEGGCWNDVSDDNLARCNSCGNLK